jgi:hypothetical protein
MVSEMGLKIIDLTDGSREVLVQNLFIAFIITPFLFFLKKILQKPSQSSRDHLVRIT